MKIGELLDRLAKLKPHAYTQAEVTDFLNRAEGRIFAELIQTHENPDEIVFSGYDDYSAPGYTGTTTADTVLIAPDPYDELYLYYLMMQVDLHNMEFPKYQNSKTLYNAAYQDFSNFWNRERTPVQRVTHFQL